MTFSKKNLTCLFLCIFIIILLCVSQVISSTALVLVCFACFMLSVVWATLNGMAMPVLLFFLPWSPLLKVDPGSMTAFTFAVILVCLLALLNHGFRFDRNLLVIMIFIVSITMFTKVYSGYSIDNSYILFMMLLAFFPILSKEVGEMYSFYGLTVFFAIGIATSALSAQYLLNYPSISRYIVVYNFNQVTRFSGYYGDPNFYSAHIAVALSGVLLLLVGELNKKRKAVLVFILLVLMYCGLLSASKAFIIVFLCLLVVWVLYVLFAKNKISAKIAIFVGIILIGVVILTSSVFSEALNVIILRFTQSSDNVSDLTTGRSDIWIEYLHAIFSDIRQLLFGVGFTNVKYKNMGSHNTIVQMLYQFGLVGSTLFISWIVFFARKIINFGKPSKRAMLILVLIIGCFGMWLSIDLLFFDEIFLIPFYACTGINWISRSGAGTED